VHPLNLYGFLSGLVKALVFGKPPVFDNAGLNRSNERSF